jgi:uncharacterized membrane protein (DUF106 family)
MSDNEKIKVYLTDRMVLVGIALGAIYWMIDTFLCVISSNGISFCNRMFGPGLDYLSTRIIVLCLFLIFGSHAQYSFKRQKRTETDLEELKEMNEKLQEEIQELKKRQDTV